MSAAGPGRLSARLSTRTPRRGFRGFCVVGAVVAGMACGAVVAGMACGAGLTLASMVPEMAARFLNTRDRARGLYRPPKSSGKPT